MNIDFELVMVIALLLCGLLWGLDVKFWRPARERAAAQAKSQMGGEVDQDSLEKLRREPVLVEYARSFFPVILVVLLLRGFVVEPFRIPSGSMMPTLLVGDFIMVNKFAYGLRLPVLKTKFVNVGDPQRGDVVVFRFPEDPTLDYIKRVVGVPGDVIGYRDKKLYVNGELIKQEYLDRYIGSGAGIAMSGAEVRTERLNEVNHQILVDPNRPSQYFETTVPEGSYFVLGDNRDNSNDSRFWGFVPEQNLVGKAFMIWMSWDDGIGWGRIGSAIE